ncbi:sugar transferase [Patescibacteria group bacterium]|nr:MAG: sugar transferase [Patescibacteria group bacterium]
MDRAIVTLRRLGLVFGDLAVFFLALVLALVARRLAGEGTFVFAEHWPPFAAIFILWIIIFAALGLYDLTLGRDRTELFGELITATAAAAAVAVAFFYLVPGIGISPKTTLFLVLLASFALLVPWRLVSLRLLAGGKFRRRIVFVGLTDEARELITRLTANPLVGLDVAGAITLDGTNAPGVPVRRTLEGFAEYLREERADTVVLAMSPRTSTELTRQLYESIFLKINFLDIIGFYEQITRRVPISAITRVWFLENLQESSKRFYEKLKRGTDIALALILGATTLALTPIVAALVWLEDRGPTFFAQERVGRDGRIFRIKKFRTMSVDAEKSGAQFAEKSDGRVTRVGRILRLTRLDELPQCWNILTGEMSFIGPRPERPEFVQGLVADMPYYPMRLLVRPGLTGWAQVNHSYYATAEEHRLKLQYDLFYLKNRSYLLDWLILLKTLNTVVRARGQ